MRTRNAHASAILLALASGVSASIGAEADNNIEWGGVSHVLWQDLRPIVPMRDDAFTVRFQAFQSDLTDANVILNPGASQSVHGAEIVGQIGPYDVWEASLPGIDADDASYVVELTDGTDTDYLGAAGVSDGLPASAFELDFVTLSHAPEGSTPVDGGVVFKVWTPTASSCRVRGEFNDWTTANPMTRVGEHFIAFVPGAETGQMYKYFFNNSVWNSDPRSHELVPTDNYNSVIRDPLTYEWRNDAFVADPLDQLVVYQLHVGTFSGRNDPAGPTANPSGYLDVANRVGHLVELGVNAVMLNPINEFPGDFSGGYNSVSMFAWESNYGTPDDLKHMIDELHAHGIAVLLDGVWNHISSSDNFLWNYDGTQLYFDAPNAQDTPWGAQADFDDPGVFRYFTDSVHHVMGEFRIDGYRQDAVMAMTDSGWTGQWSSGQDLMREMNAIIDNRYDDAHTIAEIYIDSPWVQTGIHFDSQYHNQFKNTLRDQTFNAGFGGVNMAAIANVVDGTAVSGTAVFNYFELHDDAWPLNGHERAVRSIDITPPHDDRFARGRVTLANAITILSKGVPAILQGTEWLENDGWEENKIDWAHKTIYRGVFDFYSDLIALRTSEPALFANANTSILHINEGQDVMAFQRWEDDGKSFVAVVNYANDPQTGYRLGMPRDGRWRVAIDSQSLDYDGEGGGSSGVLTTEAIAQGPNAQSLVLDIPAMGVLLLEHEPACSAADTAEPLGVLNFNDVVAFLTAFSAGEPGADLAEPFGTLNFNDVVEYLTLFSQGCP